ncbi:MAG: LuxR C-terminal-related transcriptional regulator, partial [Micrococcales bacterium]|nr:LuxR C-terminal-related transcriptional regulator [Micrococcales bacterium]
VAEHLRRSGVLVSRRGILDGVDVDGSLTPRLTLTSSRAAILNVRIADYWRAEVEALRATWNADQSIENAVPLIQALNATSAAPAEFASVIDNTRRTGADPEWAARFAEWHAAYLGLVNDDIDGACQVLAEQAAALPKYAAQLRTVEATLRLYIGPVPDESMLVAPKTDEDPIGAQGIQLVRIGTAIATGHTSDALDGLSGYVTSHPVHAERHRVVAGLARVVHGDFDEGVEWALRGMAGAETGLNLGEIYGHAYVAALGLAFAGRLDDLDALLGPVLTLSGTTMLSEHFQIGVIALAALAAGWRGRLDYGWSLSVQAETTGRRPGPYPGMLHGVTPLVPDRSGGMEEAGLRLWAAVDERLSKGFTAAAIAVAITAVEALPDPGRAEEVIAQAKVSQSPFLVALSGYVAATASGDPDALAEVADDLWNRGARLHAVKALVSRAFVLRVAEDIEGSVAQSQEAWEKASELGQRPRGLFLRLGMAVGLSPREREIALMIADGMTSQKVASSLGLSVRTVENYLVGAYRKLSCEGRDDLVRAVTTWAALQ